MCGELLPAQSDWPVYRSNSALNSCSTGALDFDVVEPAQPFEKQWPDHSLGDEILAAPVVEHGLLIVCSRRGGLHILNQFTGEPLADLRIASGNCEDCSAAVCGSMLVATGGDRIVAFNLLRAFEGWLAGRFRLAEAWHAPLATADYVLRPLNMLGARSGDRPALLVCAADANGGVLSCFALDTGEPLWTEPARLPAAVSAPAIGDDDAIYTVAADNRVYRVCSRTGHWQASTPLHGVANIDVAPAWFDDTFYFFDEGGGLCACHTSGADLSPARAAELNLHGVKGLAVSSRGILVCHGVGLTKLSLGGQLIWGADSSMGPMSGSPVIAGDCGLAVAQNRSVAYLCDLKGGFLRLHRSLICDDMNVASPAFAGDVLYTCSLHGTISALRVQTVNGGSA